MAASVLAKYIKISSASALSKGISAVSGLYVIFVLNQILDKDDFGLFMLALAWAMIIALFSSSFFRSLILYHLSRDESRTDIVGASLFYGSLLTGLLALGFYGLSTLTAELMGKATLDFWFQSLALYIPAYGLNIILTCYYRARQKVGVMLYFQEIIPNILKMILLSAVWFIGFPPIAIGYSFVLCYLIPFLILYLRSPVSLNFNIKTYSLWDVYYGTQISINQILNKSTRNLVLAFLGFFANASIIAELAVAMRIGQLLLMPKLILAQLHIPRIGEKLAQNDRTGLMKEFNTVRSVSLTLTVLGSLCLVIIGSHLLCFFGDYASAYPLLMLLSVASIIRAGFGDIGGFISMTGHASSALFSNILSMITVIVAIVVLVNPYGAFGAGAALVLAAFVNMVSIAYFLYAHEKFKVVELLSSAVMIISSAALINLAFQGAF